MRSSVKKAYVKGEQTLIANLSVLDKHMNDAVADGLRKFGGEIESLSTRYCPVETGELRSRVFNEGPLLKGKTHTQIVGYEKFGATWKGGAYALPVHERTEVHHTVGGAKFLEKALNEKSGECAQYLKKILGQVKL